LLGIDASRIIKAEKPTNKKIKLLGIFLAVPQAVMGVILVAFGVVFPFIGIDEIISNRAVGRSGVFPFLMTVTAIAFLVVGAYYLREGLGFSDRND
jgi:hypothetical protein